MSKTGDNHQTVFYGGCGIMFQGPARNIKMTIKLHKKKCEMCRIATHDESNFDGLERRRTDRGGMGDGISYSKNGNLIVKPKIQNVVEKLLIEGVNRDVSGTEMIEIVKKTVN